MPKFQAGNETNFEWVYAMLCEFRYSPPICGFHLVAASPRSASVFKITNLENLGRQPLHDKTLIQNLWHLYL